MTAVNVERTIEDADYRLWELSKCSAASHYYDAAVIDKEL
jgi:hypothetical protein